MSGRRGQLAMAAVGMGGLVLILVGIILAGYLPPPKASDSAVKLASFYAEHPDRTRLGLLVLLFAMCGFGTLSAGMAIVLRRVEGDRPVFAIGQTVFGAINTLLLSLFCLLLAAAAFRTGRSPEITQALHDAGWFMAFLAAPAFATQAFLIAAGSFADADGRLLPRWFGYLNAWIGVLLIPGVLLIFFKSGPFSYQGVISFWVPLGAFAAWMTAMAWAIRRSALTP